MANSLETLLRRIRDGVSSSEEMERARTLVLADDRLPAELREVVLLDEEAAPSDAAGLLSVLGADDLGALLAEAIEAEASAGPDAPDAVELEAQEHDPTWAAIRDVLVRELQRRSAHVELAEVVVRQMPELRDWVWGPVLAEAVYLHAGRIDVAAAVVAELGLDAGLDVAAAVRAEAGEVDVSGLVMREVGIGAAVPQLAEAVRAEAGTVDVTDAVARALALESPVVMPAGGEQSPVLGRSGIRDGGRVPGDGRGHPGAGARHGRRPEHGVRPCR